MASVKVLECISDVTAAQWNALPRFGVDREAMQVRAWAPIATVSARLIDERFGCAVQ